jgi:uncharacterized protein (DUF342 family)
MVKLSDIQDYMASQAQADRGLRSVRVEGESLEEALESGAVQLGLPLEKLEYEVAQRGDGGLLGLGRRTWVLQVYEAVQKETPIASSGEDGPLEGNGAEVRPTIRPGEVFVKLVQGNVFLKVTKPEGKAPRVSEEAARAALARRGIIDFDNSMMSRVVRRADGEFVVIGSFDYNPANDALMTVDIVEQEMKAVVEVRAPGRGGADLTFDTMVTILKNNGVYHGIQEDALREFEDRPRYNVPVVVALGTPPENGADATIERNFSIDRTRIPKEKNGKVDYRELNLVENVVAGQILARKVPAEEGRPGRTVTGKTLAARHGRDCDFVVGKNVKLSEDGTTALAEINGQVLEVQGRINVEPLYTVAGDVNLHTGNILFLGAVIVKGSVDDGFSVKAAGSIEVFGNVGKSTLDAEGDIIVHQGILGKNGGQVRAGGSVYAKFIEHAHVEAGTNVIANEGIIHSFVDANSHVICHGRRASIVGGRLRAAEEINAKNLGSVAGSETILEVGYDPKTKERMVELERSSEKRREELQDLERNLRTLVNLKKVQKKLPDEKEEYLNTQMERRSELIAAIEGTAAEMTELKERLASVKRQGKIGASDNAFAGCKIYIRDAALTLRQEQRQVTFILDGGNVKTTKYEPIDESLMKRG